MSQSALARATKTRDQEGLRQPTIWHLESGRNAGARVDTLFRLAAALNCSPEWLRTGSGDPFSLTVTTNAVDEASRLMQALSPEKQAMILAAIKAISTP